MREVCTPATLNGLVSKDLPRATRNNRSRTHRSLLHRQYDVLRRSDAVDNRKQLPGLVQSKKEPRNEAELVGKGFVCLCVSASC